MRKRNSFFSVLSISSLVIQFCLIIPAFAAGDEITEHTLQNGLGVLVLEKHTTPVVAVQVWYRVGSHHEWIGVRGIAHLFEHMMFRGSENYGPEEHGRLIQEVGGSANAFTTNDMTVYHQRLPSSELELALKLEAERMHLLKLDEAVLNTELEVVKEEYRMYENDPYGKVFMKLPKIFYPADHTYSWTPLGIMADLENLSVGDCHDFYDRFYTPNNAVLVVVGDVDTENVFQLAELHFGSITAKEIPPEPDLSLLPQDEIRRFKEKAGVPVPLTGVAFYIPEARHPDIIPLKVLFSILSAGRSSRLHKSLVRDKELAVQAFGVTFVNQGPGVFGCAAAHLPNISSKRIEWAILEEINRVKTEEVTDRELQKAQKRLLAGKVFQRYSVSSLAHSIGSAEVVEGDYRLFQREVEEFGKVTKADILRVANRYFTEANTTIIYIQPEKWSLLAWLYGFFKSLF